MLIMPKIEIGIKLFGPDGRLIEDRTEPGHSWTRNGWNLFFAMMTDSPGSSTSFGAGYLSIKNMSGTIRGSGDYAVRRNNYEKNDFGCKINVGTGDTAFSVGDSALAAMIGHGTGGGQLSHADMANVVPTYNSETKVWTHHVSRQFLNGSGGAITVKETGLTWYGYAFYYSLESYLIARDVLETPLTINNEATGQITYNLTMDFSSIDT